MGFPFSMVITTVLKGERVGFGAPVAKEMTDFGALTNFSYQQKERVKKHNVLKTSNQYIAI